MENKPKSQEEGRNEKITRKEAIQKAGKYAAFTAASMMLLMSPASGTPQDNSKVKDPKKPKNR